MEKKKERTMVRYKPKKAQNAKGNRLLITINVLGSAGPMRFVVNEEELVASVIDMVLKSYAREGRLPVLGSDLNNFLLYCPRAGSDALSPWETIGAHGGRDFMLCMKPPHAKPVDDGKPTTAIAKKGAGSWKSWINNSLSLKKEEPFNCCLQVIAGKLLMLLAVVEGFMGPKTSVNSSGALEGVHGVHVVPHAPFALEEISQHRDHNQVTSGSSSNGASQWLLTQRVWQQRPVFQRPIHCSLNGDQNVVETVANVITSLPFIALGIHVPRKNLNCKLYANSLVGVGVASSLYHSSRGRIRKFLRWIDYTMIAAATVCLSRALRDENPKLLMAASALCLPFQPLMVSAVHTGMMEVAFARRALENPRLKMAHNMHKASSLLGGVLFIADDMFPQTPFIHAAWHLAAAVGVSTCNKLLE